MLYTATRCTMRMRPLVSRSQIRSFGGDTFNPPFSKGFVGSLAIGILVSGPQPSTCSSVKTETEATKNATQPVPPSSPFSQTLI
ncbi:hypothetical protein TrVE_jg7764 [Triparma verrucosa]|uniref:Uncharacterized protein n=1 Tax=Triparma verrucosa TaxID=1606542 RepID=A0A9W7EWE9_9STRA|nr:hypothetical protein TrVE_jg7764 [Triparma verrucosa]